MVQEQLLKKGSEWSRRAQSRVRMRVLGCPRAAASATVIWSLFPWRGMMCRAVLWDVMVDKNLCCAPMAAGGSALEHPSIRKGPMAGDLLGEGVSGHELEKLGIFGVWGAGCLV